MTIHTRIAAALAKRDMVVKLRDNVSHDLDEAIADKAAIEEAAIAIQKAALMTQDKMRSRFCDIAQSCLDAVFPDSYKFHLEFVARRGATEVDIKLQPVGTDKLLEPISANGGGVVDILALSLRVACLTLSKNARILIMDEPFKYVREGAKERLGAVITSIARKLGLQIIMVADVAGTSIVPDRVFKVRKGKDGKSVVTAHDPESSMVV